MTRVYEIDPLQDERWAPFLEKHSLATLFHSTAWLDALQRTYGFKAGALTTSHPGERLTNALLFCRVRSWLTGPRLVSVPFSDHCASLVENEEEFADLFSHLKRECDGGREKYLEIRSASASTGEMADSASFCLHRLDLRPSMDELFHALHESCIRRKIARSGREGVTYEEGTSKELLNKFYRLTVLTRQRHQIPPQPLSWFRNLIASTGEDLKIRLATYRGQPAAGILTIRYGSVMTYKYGCSDSQFHRLGPMQMLIWKAIQEAKAHGLLEFDMGRTHWNNLGLLAFKDRWGCSRSVLTYRRYPAAKLPKPAETAAMRIAKSLVALAPNRLLATAGGILYRHID